MRLRTRASLNNFVMRRYLSRPFIPDGRALDIAYLMFQTRQPGNSLISSLAATPALPPNPCFSLARDPAFSAKLYFFRDTNVCRVSAAGGVCRMIKKNRLFEFRIAERLSFAWRTSLQGFFLGSSGGVFIVTWDQLVCSERRCNF